MTELSPSLAARARKIESVVLQRLAERKQVKVAGEAGCSESTVSRFASDRLPEVAKILAALNLCVVSEDAHGKEQITVYNPECLATEPEEVTDVDGDGVVEINDAELAAKVKKLEDPNNF